MKRIHAEPQDKTLTEDKETSMEESNDRLLEKATAIAEDIRYMESLNPEKAFRKGLEAYRIRRRTRNLNRLVRGAACLSLPLLISVICLAVLRFNNQDKRQYASICTPNGSVVRYELPDNSVVWLNSGTTLRHPVAFGRKSREVELSGEAFFEVEANPERPFYVNTSNGVSVKVYGTRFNVSAYDDAPAILTTLESGHVDVISASGSIALRPGEQASYVKESGRLSKKSVNTSEHLAWKDGKMIFRNAGLGEIFEAVGKKFGVAFKINGKLPQETFRATFRHESLEQILDTLAGMAGFSWSLSEETADAGAENSESSRTVTVYFR